jgi:RNA polymerase sigma factor (sigma-70 family)
MAMGQKSKILPHLRKMVGLREEAGASDAQLLARFIDQRDEVAFEALVRRHGPMVFGVCRRVLHCEHDAEDAFQAAFLVLVRKAASIRSRELLANWLFGVAYKTALKARALAARRRARETQVTDMPEPVAVPQEDLWQELQPLLDRELSRLPDKYRIPVLLCELQGMTRKEAARQLTLAEGTLSSRLARAKAMLAKRLARHGLAVSGAALGLALAENRASAWVPAALVASTSKAAGLLAAGQALTAGAVSPNVAALTEGVVKAMFLTRLKTITAMLVLLTAVGGGIGLFCSATSRATPPSNPALAEPGDGEPGGKNDAADAKEVTEELARLQGTWVMAAVQWKGEEPAEQDVTTDARRLLVIQGNKCVEGQVLGRKGEWFLRLDPTRRPKQIDMSASAEFKAGAVTFGIYELKDDSLKILWGGKKPEGRPQEMKATNNHDGTKGEGLVVYWKRVQGGEQDAKEGPPPVPGAVALQFDRKLTIGVKSNPIKVRDTEVSIVGIGTGIFHLSKEARLTATLNAGVYQHAKVDYWIYAGVFDARGKLLGTASHKESVLPIRLGQTPMMLREIEFDFGTSRDFSKAAFVVVSISNPEVPEP